MKYIFQLVILSETIIFVSLVETELTVVTEIDQLESYYERIYSRSLQTRFHRTPRENTIQRRALCEYITGSPFFDMNDEDHVDPEDVQDELKLRNRDIFFTIYDKAKCCFCFHCRGRYEYVNSYELRNVTVNGETRREWLFVCLTRYRKPLWAEIIPYYVSAEYNVSEALPGKDFYIAGRFVFVKNGDTLELLALAEEPAMPPKNMDATIEDHYIRVKNHFKSSEKPEDDPICRLTRKNRVRICASVLSSSSIENNIDFIPKPENVTNTCNKNKITFKIPEVLEKLEQGDDEQFREWMIVCRARKVEQEANNDDETVSDDESVVEYLISQAYESNEVFVYTWNEEESGKVFIENLSTHVNIKLDHWEYNI